VLQDDLAAARAATTALLAHLDALTPRELAGPSLLPSWSRGHVVAHLAGNARSHVRMLEGCLAGEVRDQYADGAAGRDAAIDALAGCWDAMDEAHWARDVRPLDAPPRPATELVWSRWKEVLVHRVDLDAGCSWRHWPDAFAIRLLHVLVDRDDLPAMTLDAGRGLLGVGGGGGVVTGTPAALAAWLIGRSDGTDLSADGALPQVPPWT